MAAGHLKNGASIEAVTLSNSSGISARILTYGATLQSLIAPDAEGAPADIVLGHDDVAGYEETRGFLGVTVAMPTASPVAASRSTALYMPWSGMTAPTAFMAARTDSTAPSGRSSR